MIPPVGTAFGTPEAAEHEHALLQPVAAVRPRAGRRLARRDRRARLHRLEAGLPDHHRVDDGEERHRHDRDQRRRPRRRPARDAHGGANDGTTVTFSAGGRGIDQDGNGTIDSTEGVSAAPPFTAVGNRDGLRQTVIDLMQLTREIQVGVDVNGDGRPDLDASKISYFGQSFGGIYGTTFLGVEPAVHAGVLNVPGGSITEIARLSPSFRPLVGISLATRVPSLYNAVPNATFTNFNEDMPLSGLPPVIDTVPGADAIQNTLDQQIWAQTPADPSPGRPSSGHSRSGATTRRR